MVNNPAHEQNERYRLLYEFYTSAARSESERSDQNAAEFAKLLIQSSFLIHGGALVAMLTRWDMLSVALNETAGTVKMLFTCFVAGITSSFVAGMCGFFALSYRATGALKAWEAAGCEAAAKFLEEEGQAELAAESRIAKAKLDAQGECFTSKYGPLRTAGIVALVMSLALFAVGAWLGVFVIRWGATAS